MFTGCYEQLNVIPSSGGTSPHPLRTGTLGDRNNNSHRASVTPARSPTRRGDTQLRGSLWRRKHGRCEDLPDAVQLLLRALYSAVQFSPMSIMLSIGTGRTLHLTLHVAVHAGRSLVAALELPHHAMQLLFPLQASLHQPGGPLQLGAEPCDPVLSGGDLVRVLPRQLPHQLAAELVSHLFEHLAGGAAVSARLRVALTNSSAITITSS
mmetsp:Transcript_40129/g.114832  ORF Transcript_40129/g.114832 Transcript_40129/m.114832 type:complete len:209 (-) Transcript_40129:62-688(-)